MNAEKLEEMLQASLPYPGEVTKVDHMAARIAGRADTQSSGTAVQISVRVQVYELAHVQAIADKIGRSRNHVINELLGIALEELASRTPGDQWMELSATAAELVQSYAKQADLTRED